MKMKRYIFIISAVFAVVSAAAQDDITKQLEVTKAYTPKVGQAAKLPVEPRMVDTVQLRPEIDYSITPTAWRTAFTSDKYEPAVMSVVPFEKHRQLYLRAGFGYPLQSTADLYFNPYVGNKSTFGLFFNHRGSYSKIGNDLGIKPKSTEMLNAAGLYGSKYYRLNKKLEGGAGYDNRLYTPYGVIPSTWQPDWVTPATNVTTLFSNESFNLGRIRGNISYGDTFTDLSRPNFRIGLDAGAAHADSQFYQLDIDAWAVIGKMFNAKHGIEVGIYERGAVSINKDYDVNAVAASLCPAYILSLNKFKLKAGVDLSYIHNNLDVKDRFVASPEIKATLNLVDGYVTPYLTLGSEFMDGSSEALSRRNPYVAGAALTGWTYDLRLGFSGNVNNIFSYRLQGGISWLENYTAFVGSQLVLFVGTTTQTYQKYFPLMFLPETDNGTMYTIGAELGLQNLGGFEMKLDANWNGYDFQNFPVAIGLPKYEAKLELAYSHKKFKVSAGAKLMGPRKFCNLKPEHLLLTDWAADTEISSRPAAVDVSLGAEYNVTDRFGVFIEGRNLANQKLYPYDYYRGLGTNVMLGVKAVF